MQFLTLAHLIDVDLLREAYQRARRDGAPGVDRATAAEYAANLETNLADLQTRLRRGRDDAPRVKRPDVPKEDGSQRPMGRPAFEDKLVQQAATMLLGVIDEQDFQDCSYGFREGRSSHHALHVLREWCMQEGIGWIVDADVRACFDSLEQDLVCEVLKHRVKDGAILRLSRKWLKAGVLEGGTLSDPERGSPQGGVRTPPGWRTSFWTAC